MLWSKTRPTRPRKRSKRYPSRAKALTIRMPEMFSSASAVSSAIRCCTSCRAGRELRPYRIAATITSGTGASVIAASSG